MQIFKSRVTTFISIEKCIKSDIQETWKGMLIDYTKTIKHLKVWVSCTYQVLIVNEVVINKNKWGPNLFLEHLLFTLKKSIQS